MTLEDHVGDIIRKARRMNGVSMLAAATAADLAESELAALEANGQIAQPVNFPVLAQVIGLPPQKLAAIANGWLPTAKDLSAWQNLRVFTTANDRLNVNCYLIWDSATRAAALFDTGLEAQPVLDCLVEHQLQLQHLFLTHTHWDHVEALAPIRAAWPQVRLHSSSKNAPLAQRNQPGEVIALGGLRIAHRETPGHSEDGVTYLVNHWPDQVPNIAVVGDTIFAGSMGNGNGAWDLARQKIREQILSLPAETLLCPGHGPLTTVGEETAHNPFF
jgi:glyoxylase-like metal-dependent hydrolase (beta-lactamase superfamily II)